MFKIGNASISKGKQQLKSKLRGDGTQGRGYTKKREFFEKGVLPLKVGIKSFKLDSL